VIEKLVSLDVERSYDELRRILLTNECKIVAEDPPRSITVEHGSFWAWTPRDAKKRIRFILIPQDSKTKITAITSLASYYIALFTLAFISLIIITPVLVWIVIDVESWVEGERSSFWGWLAENLLGYRGYQRMLMLIGIAKVLIAIGVILDLVSLISCIYTYIKRKFLQKKFSKC
jgi:hypothetical protein